MKRLIWIALVALCLTRSVQAAELLQEQASQYGVTGLQEGLEDHAAELMDKYDPTEQAELVEGVTEIITDALRESGGVIRTACVLMLKVLGILILCRLAMGLDEKRVATAASLGGAMAIAVCCFSDLRSMIGMGQNVMNELSSFSSLLLPVMASVSAASGAAVSSGALYGVAMLFSSLLIRLCRGVLVPLVYGYVALAMTDSALGTSRLSKIQEMLGWLIKNGLKVVVYAFMGFLTATKLVAGTADAVALKAAKATVSTAIPVVGGIISGAADTILAGASLLRSAAGTFGMLAVLAIFVLPFVQMGISYLGFKLTAALGGILEAGQGRLLDALTGAMGFMLAMVGSCGVICLYSCCCFLQVVTG